MEIKPQFYTFLNEFRLYVVFNLDFKSTITHSVLILIAWFGRQFLN